MPGSPNAQSPDSKPIEISADSGKQMPHVAVPPSLLRTTGSAFNGNDFGSFMNIARARFARFLGIDPEKKLSQDSSATQVHSPLQILASAQISLAPLTDRKPISPKTSKLSLPIPLPIAPPLVSIPPSVPPLDSSSPKTNEDLRRDLGISLSARVNPASPEARNRNRARSMSPNARSPISPLSSTRSRSISPGVSPRLGTITAGRNQNDSVLLMIKQKHQTLVQQQTSLDEQLKTSTEILHQVQQQNQFEVQQEQSEVNEALKKDSRTAKKMSSDYSRTPPVLLRAIAATHEIYNHHLSVRRLRASAILICSYLVSVVVGVGVGYYQAKTT